MGSFSYTSRAAFDSVEFLLYIPYFFHFYLGIVPYTSRAGFIFMGGMGGGGGNSFSYLVLASFLCGEFLLHIPCWLHFYVGSFSYTSHAGFILCGEFPLHTPCCLYFYAGVSLTLPVVAYIYIF